MTTERDIDRAADTAAHGAFDAYVRTALVTAQEDADAACAAAFLVDPDNEEFTGDVALLEADAKAKHALPNILTNAKIAGYNAAADLYEAHGFPDEAHTDRAEAVLLALTLNP